MIHSKRYLVNNSLLDGVDHYFTLQNWIKVQTKEDVPGKRSGHTATSIDSMMILVGGLDSHMSIFPDVWLFDVANGQWSKV